MASIECSYIMFEQTIKQVIDYWKMDGKVIKHDDFRYDRIVLFFNFTHKYLSINDMITFDPWDYDRKSILDDTVRHLKEIKSQFNYYFNAIWC